VRQLVLIANDDVIAGVLNRNGLTTGNGNRPCTDEADHTFFPKRSFKAALSSIASARSRFSFVFWSSSVFSRLASDTSMPPNLAFYL